MAERATIASPAASDCEPARIFVAIEIRKKSWLVAVVDPLAARIGRHTLPAGDGAALVDRPAARRQVPAAGGSGGWRAGCDRRVLRGGP